MVEACGCLERFRYVGVYGQLAVWGLGAGFGILGSWVRSDRTLLTDKWLYCYTGFGNVMPQAALIRTSRTSEAPASLKSVHTNLAPKIERL